MPKEWLYFLALGLPLVLRFLMFDTGFVEWLWYQHHEQAYYTLSELRVQPSFASFIGGWGLPLFVFTVGCYWQMDDNFDSVPQQFLLLPLAYIPFVIAADYLFKGELYASSLISYPLLILPFGYLYIFIWVIFIWMLEKVRLVL
jgi:hypothetical protein